MKRILPALFSFCVAGNVAAKEVVKVTYFHVPPHVIYDASTKKVSGAVVDLLEYLAPEMGVELVWDASPSNIPRQLDQLGSGERDLAAVFIYNPPDLALNKFVYSDKPYFLARDALLVKKDFPLDAITRIEEILNMKIGYAPKGTYVSGFMRDERISWDPVYTPNFNEANLKKLLAGRIAASYAPDHAALQYEVAAAKAEKSVKLVYTPEKPVQFHPGITAKKPRLRQKYDQAFAKLNGATKYLEFLSKYTGRQ